jgi:hypothetical protein
MDLYGRVRVGGNLWFRSKDASLIQNIRDSIDIDIKEARPAEYYNMNNSSFVNSEILKKGLKRIEEVFAKREKDIEKFCKKNPELRKQINELKRYFEAGERAMDDLRMHCAEVLYNPQGIGSEFPQEKIDALLKFEYNRYHAEGFVKLENICAKLRVKEGERLARYQKLRALEGYDTPRVIEFNENGIVGLRTDFRDDFRPKRTSELERNEQSNSYLNERFNVEKIREELGRKADIQGRTILQKGEKVR